MPDSLTTAPPGDNPTLPACTLQTAHPRASHLLWMQEPEVQGHKRESVSTHVVLSEHTPPPGENCPDAIYCSFMTFLILSALCILKAHFCTTLSPILFITFLLILHSLLSLTLAMSFISSALFRQEQAGPQLGLPALHTQLHFP